jgi:hypothetical protein
MTRPDHLEHAADAHREAIGLIAQFNQVGQSCIFRNEF